VTCQSDGFGSSSPLGSLLLPLRPWRRPPTSNMCFNAVSGSKRVRCLSGCTPHKGGFGSLATTRPPFGGLRWWFVCPHLNRRVRKLYLPLGGRHFWSRHAYELAYASQRETKYDRALRRARKLRLKSARWADLAADDMVDDLRSRARCGSTLMT
jgi:hypothetical protein